MNSHAGNVLAGFASLVLGTQVFGQGVMRTFIPTGSSSAQVPGAFLVVGTQQGNNPRVESLPWMLDGSADQVGLRAAARLFSGQTVVNDAIWLGGPVEGLGSPVDLLAGFSISVPPTPPQFVPINRGSAHIGPDDSRVIYDRTSASTFLWDNQIWARLSGSNPIQQTLIDGQLTRVSPLTEGYGFAFQGVHNVAWLVGVRPPLGQTPDTPVGSFLVGSLATGLRTVLRNGQQAPGCEEGVTIQLQSTAIQVPATQGNTIRLTPSGKWVLMCDLLGENTSGRNAAIYVGSTATPELPPRLLLRRGDQAFGFPLGFRVQSWGRPSINDQGVVAISALVQGPFSSDPLIPAIFSWTEQGGWVQELTTDQLISHGAITIRNSSTGLPAGTTRISAWTSNTPIMSPALDSQGNIAIVANTSIGQAAIHIARGENDARTRKVIAVASQVIPRTLGRVGIVSLSSTGTAAAVPQIGIGPDGTVVLVARTIGQYDPRRPVVQSTPVGILSWTPQAGLSPLVLVGATLDAGFNSTGVITFLDSLIEANPGEGVNTAHGQASALACHLSFRQSLSEQPTEAAAVFDTSISACGLCDIATQGAVGHPDGQLDTNDLVLFIDRFFDGDLRADYGGQGGVLAADGRLNSNDLVAFINEFFLGCD